MCVIRLGWDVAKTCCGPKMFYTTIGVGIVVLIATLVIGVVVPLQQWAVAPILLPTPAPRPTPATIKFRVPHIPWSTSGRA